MIDLSAGRQHDPEYLRLNPNGKVPTLVIDGSQVMFEAAAITMYLADRHPAARLAPAAGEIARGHYYQWMAHLTNTLQPAMSRFYHPELVTSQPAGEAGVVERAKEEVADVWGRIDQHLNSTGPYLLGDKFSAADIFLLMLSTWHETCPDAFKRFTRLARLAELVAARPAMRRMLQQNDMTWPLRATS
jgi:glutathione S-transferase